MAVLPPPSLLTAKLDSRLAQNQIHEATIEISTRGGVAFDVKAVINEFLEVIPTTKYLKAIRISRGVNTPASMTFSLAPLESDDIIARLAQGLEGNVTPFAPTWRQILRPGSICKPYINGEFKGIFLVREVKKVTTPTSRYHQVTCYGIQEFLQRQSLFFHAGNEKIGAYSLLAIMPDIDTQDLFRDPATAIETVIKKFLFDTLQGGQFRFANTHSIDSYVNAKKYPLGGLSRISYYGFNSILLQSIKSVNDFSIWDELTKFQLNPFHEFFVTHGGLNLPLGSRRISLGSGQTAILPEDIEYVIFRPTPYDDPTVEGSPFPIPVKALPPPGSVAPLPFHTVQESMTWTGNAITDFHVKSNNLYINDNNGYSMFGVTLGGQGMDANLSGRNFPPLVDLEAMRFLGKRVLDVSLQSLNGQGIEIGERTLSFETLAKSLQLKLYHWFKNNTEYIKGTILTRWISNLAEGEHLWYETDLDNENYGYYYINSYDLTFDVAAKKVEYLLNVTRGTPQLGFTSRSPLIPYPTEIRLTTRS